MSGTSLDGLDIAYCSFSENQNGYSFSILHYDTIHYDKFFKQRLSSLHLKSISEILAFDSEFGKFSGNSVLNFCKKRNIKLPDYIASHGHTLFHQPENGFSFQIGKGSVIAKHTGIDVVCDFRSADIALGGEGAPLVPIGDELLFGDYDACLNLGGFSNISFKENNNRIAFDISPVNIILNELAGRINMDYDKNGNIARSGEIILEMLDSLNSLDFYSINHPKSLSREWLEKTVNPIINKYLKNKTEDLLRTFCEHVAFQISRFTKDKTSVLATGGGAFNSFLIERINYFSNNNIILPTNDIINYKEALIFAFLGYLRILNKENCYASATGAPKNSCCGSIYSGK